MKKSLQSFLLMAFLLLVGSSAWADAGDVTKNADIDFSNAISEGVVTGTVNSMTIGGESYLQDGWLRLKETGNCVVTIPEAQRAGSRDVVNIQFKRGWGNKSGMGSGFSLTDADGGVICEFSYARWGSAATNTNTMNIDMTGMLGAHQSNAPIKERYTLFDIIINYATKTITSYVENVNSDGKGTPKSATFTASLTNTKPIAAFNTWGFGVGGNTDRADSFDDLIIKTTEGDYNVVSANYTVNWVCGSDIVKTETRTGDVGSAIVLLEADKEKFYTFSDDKTKKYQYVSDNTEGLTIADGGTTVVEIKLSEVGKYTYSVVDNWGNTIVSGEQFEDEAQMVYWSKYAKNDGKWYQASGEEFGMEMNNVDNEWTVNYSTESSISYFFEAENLNKTKDPATEASGVKYSAGKGIGHYSGSTWYSEPLTEGGVYTLAIAGYARRSGGENIGVSIRDAEGNITETGKSFEYTNEGTEQIYNVVEGIEIPAGCSIALVQPNWNSTSYIDYITLTKTADLVQTYTVTISNEIENGTVVADPTSAKAGDVVTLTNTPAEGYEFVSYSVTGKTIDEAVIVTDGKFTMPADDVTVSATFQLPTPPSYDITVADNIENGTVTVDPTTAKAGEEVTVTATPAEGYELASISVTGQTSNLAVEVSVDGKFTMPADAVTVNAKFQQKAVDPSGDEEIALAADMFYTWDGDGANASKISPATVDFKLGESVAAGGVVAGTGGVLHLTYADMTGSTKVIFEGTNGTVIRLLMNRQDNDNDGPLVEKNATIADGKAEISLTDLAYVHINAIKIPWNGSTDNIISAITFVKPNDPLAGPKEALKDAIAAAKLQNSVAKTEESFAALTKAISDGEVALADAQATVESLTTAKSDIETAVKGLTLAEGYAEVTKEMFKQYASVDEPGEGTATGGAYELFTASGLPYGDGSVSELKWADLTKYDKLIVTVAGATAPRFCMNRLVKDGQQAATQEESKMLDINPNNGNTWSTEKYQTASDGVYTIDLAAIVKDYSFARLHCIKAQGGGSTVVTGMYLHEAPVTYDITVADGIENGTVTVDPTTAKAGDEVTITATPAEGYELASISVTGVTSNEAVIVTDGKFTMPADDVTVSAKFKFAPVDKTDLITNWDFTSCQNNNFPGWTIYAPNGGNTWANGDTRVEYWIGTAANGVFDYYQDIDAPDGVYTLTANMWNSTNGVATDAVNGNAGVYGTSSGVTVFAGVTDDCDNANLHQYTTEPIKVLDGKLRLGVKNNGVMGARWFGVDWIKLTQIGKVQALDYEAGHTEALNAAKATLSAEENAIVVGEERTALEAAIEKNSEVAEQTVEAYKAAIKALQTASNDFTAARAGYAALASTKETLLGYAEKYVYASAEKTAAVTAAAEAAPTSADDATSKNVNLINALRAMAESHAKAEGVEGAEAIAITNPSAEDNTNGWTTVKGEGSDGAIDVKKNEPWTSADGSTAHQYFDGGNWGASAWDVSLTQNVELAAGKYMLSAISRASGDVALTIFAGENKTTMPSIGAAGGIFDRGWNISSVEFEVNANSTVTIGVQGVTSVIHNWMSFSDFKLVLIESYAVKVAKAELLEAINKAKAIDTEGKNGAKELATAITVAEGVYNNEEATLEGVNTAKSDLAAAVAAFDEANKVYAVNVDAEIENGTVAVNPTSAKAGDEVTITATPAEGYELASITVTGVASEEIVEVTDGKFTMPADDVTVTATFVQTTGIDAASAAKGKKIGVKKYFKNGELIIIGKDGKEFRANGAAK